MNRDREGFAPPAPFTMDELDPAGVLPDRVYAKAELLAYLAHGRAKCARTIAAMSGADAWARHGSARPEIPAGELLLDNLRHVQHHVGQLQMILGQVNGEAPRYVTTSTLDRRLGE